MGKLTTDVYDGQPDHAGVHNLERTAHNTNDDRIDAARARADDAHALAFSKPDKPVGGWAAADIADGAAVKTDGSILRAVKLTQAAYDALATKVATTLYIIEG